jgi:UDP-N-acetylmuramate dehydrogenase
LLHHPMLIEENIPLAPLTTFKVGGPARYFARVHTQEELREALGFAQKNNLSVLHLGGGSNMLVADAGWSGLVIKIELRGIAQQNGLVVAGAGEEWDALVAYAAQHGLWGIENLSGIPGTVGAAPVQNIGAYGAELGQTLQFVEALDTRSAEVVRFAGDECGFGYRTSRFKREPGRFIALRVGLRLASDGLPNTAYRDLAERFQHAAPSISAVRDAVLAIRKQKFPDLAKEGTAGSFFLNPVVPQETARALQERYPGLPTFPAPQEGMVKIPLGWLLDKVLNLRGYREGRVRLFEHQALVVVAEPGATAAEVQALASFVRTQVQENLGITIEPEVQILDSGAM